MIEEKIIDALNDIDDDMLEEVDRRRLTVLYMD